MRQFWKAVFALILLVGVLGAGLKADAAVKPGTPEPVEKKPYEYEFEVTDKEYNGFKGAKQMVITFDKEINPILPSDVYVEQIVDGKGVVVPIIASVTPPTSSATNKLIITFKNLELIDHVGKDDLRLVIKQGKLYFDQITDYVLPFKFYDLTPGFNSIFLDVENAKNINTNIFKYNEPRNVMIQVPPVYMTKIETIHRYIEAVGPGDAASKQSPNLSNIDVIADPAATRMKVKLGTGIDSEHSRDLDRSTAGVNGFSLGQAGIDTIVCKDPTAKEDDCNEYNDQIQLTAYSKDGRKLETRNFKMRVNDPQKDFKINDYVKANPKLYGKPISLYDFMASPTLLNDIMQETTLGKLDDFGVVYSVGNEAVVETRDQFNMALKNDKLKKIKLKNNITLTNTEPFIVNRDVIISGGNITGDVVLGIGEKRLIRLEKTTITGNLTVDVGKEGTAVLDDVNVNGNTSDPHTKIVSGGTNSIYLNNFKSAGGIILKNEEPIRIVTTASTGELIANEFPSLHLQGAGKVHLQGKFNEVELLQGAKGIHFVSYTEIDRITTKITINEELEKIELTGNKVKVNNLDRLNDILKIKLGKLEEVKPGDLEDIRMLTTTEQLIINDLNNTKFELDNNSNLHVSDSFKIENNWKFERLINKSNKQVYDIENIELSSNTSEEHVIKLPDSFSWEPAVVYEAEFFITISNISYKLIIPFKVSQ
ncbi:hypothetical protein CSV63_13855 [Sporosarcina sp. P34]|uniref:pectate lyase-like adhesive domain-containing protein n=1 Tax=Sporosarcina sp. P34 TaxID=2048247 RepID=UPI000C60F7BE|nr:pectate lyase-like adhesive domain-containing protein [Sporosarcina sp. P34]PID14170.1 hypothetical protein CSV63_13855 [Sporosarcina sp. P34]